MTGCLVMSVIDSAVLGNSLYAIAWISAPYLLAAVLLFSYGFLFVYNRGLWSDNAEGSMITDSFLTAVTICTPLVFTSSHSKGLHLSIKPQLLCLVGAGMVIIWSMAIVVFVSPAYVGVIVLVTTQVLYFWYLLDVRWSSNLRLSKACQTLHEASGDLAVTLIERMEADEENSECEPQTLTILRSLRGGLWNVFQEAIIESVACSSQNDDNESRKRKNQNVWKDFVTLPGESLSGEKEFRYESSNVRSAMTSRAQRALFRCISCGRCKGSTPRLPSQIDLQEVLQPEEETTKANEKWIIAIATAERYMINRGQLADTLIRTDWKAFLQWCVGTPYTILRRNASAEAIATLQHLWSKATGNTVPKAHVSSDGAGDDDNSVVAAPPLEVSPDGAERRDALISDVFLKYGNERGEIFCRNLTALDDAYKEWQKTQIETERREKKENDEAERRRKELGG